jgi:D-alanine-D-alanine ligase
VSPSSSPTELLSSLQNQLQSRPAATNGSGQFDDTYAEWDDEDTIAAIEAALSHVGDVIRLEADHEFPLRLREARPDIVFNFAESLGGSSRESFVPAFCEFWGIPYTGSDPLTQGICLDKARTKETLIHHGIPTPEFQVARCPGDVRRDMALPVIVKPLHEGSSKGITERSFCATWEEVEDEVARVVERYREPAIIERFLDGREFTAAVLGNDGDGRVLPIVELDYSTLPGGSRPLYGFEAKWVWDRPENPLDIFQCPARCTPELERRIKGIAMAAYRILRCRDWARIDIRCDSDGSPHVLEVNPLPGVIPDPDANSCYPKAARAAGLSFDEVILGVLQAAAARYDLRVID